MHPGRRRQWRPRTGRSDVVVARRAEEEECEHERGGGGGDPKADDPPAPVLEEHQDGVGEEGADIEGEVEEADVMWIY